MKKKILTLLISGIMISAGASSQTVKDKELKWFLIISFLLLIQGIGFSRVYLRVHYASDVIAGFCVGILWLVICVSVLNRLEKFSMKKINPVVQQPSVEEAKA